MNTDHDDAAAETPADVATALQALRERSGATYADVAMRIAARRVADGAAPSAARVARSTVFDAFRVDRTRLNPSLVAEIVVALGESADTAQAWRERAQRANATRKATPAPEPDQVDEPEPTVEPVSVAEPLPEIAPAESYSPISPNWWARHGTAVVIIAASVALNLLGHRVVAALELPLFFDMIGTAITAIAVGPWQGALVALVTNIAGIGLSNPNSVFFALVNVAGALLWGYGVRHLGLARSLLRFLGLNLAVGLLCSILATPIIVNLMDGVARHALDRLSETWLDLEHNPYTAVFGSNLLHSVPDKLIAGFLALVVLASLGSAARNLAIPADSVFTRLSSANRSGEGGSAGRSPTLDA